MISEDLHSYCKISIGDVYHQCYILYFSFSKQASARVNSIYPSWIETGQPWPASDKTYIIKWYNNIKAEFAFMHVDITDWNLLSIQDVEISCDN